jgi:hypothetical protein
MRANNLRAAPSTLAQLARVRQFVMKIVTSRIREQALVGRSAAKCGNTHTSTFGSLQPGCGTTICCAARCEWSAAERNAYLPGKAYLLYVSAHEVWPGHYLQSQFTNANPSRVEALWWDYAFGEGWAHYTEEMMYDAGLGAGQPEMRVGMVTNALLRGRVPVRRLSAQWLQPLRRDPKDVPGRGVADAGNARQQALRGLTTPDISPTLGKLMIRKLPADWLSANLGYAAVSTSSCRTVRRRFLVRRKCSTPRARCSDD